MKLLILRHSLSVKEAVTGDIGAAAAEAPGGPRGLRAPDGARKSPPILDRLREYKESRRLYFCFFAIMAVIDIKM